MSDLLITATPSFGFWDYVVLITILLISASIGLYYRYTGGRQRTTKEYLMADQNMSAWVVAFSLMASFMSAITILGVSSESYQYGTLFCIINLAYILSTPIAAYLFLPVFYKMRTTSVYEYLERRFGHATRLSASIAYTIQMILYMGIVLYAPALALEAVTGLNKSTAILGIGMVCTFYSTIGGMKAVLITDVFQSLLMFAAIYAVIIMAAVKGGGLGAIWTAAEERGRLELFDFRLDPTIRHTWWSLIIGGMVTYLSLYGVNQTQIQRLLSVRDLRGAQSALWWNLPILSCLSFSTLFSGLAIFHYYQDCDPLREGRINSRDQLMPLFAVDTMSGQYPGLCGLFVSGIFSASLSTVSSAVSSLAAVSLEDYMKPLYKWCFKKPLSDTNSTLPSKIVAFIYGLICIGLAFGAGSLGSVLQASLTIFGVVGGPLLAIFVLGMCTTRSNQRGVLLGMLVGLLFSFAIGFGGPKPRPHTLEFSTEMCEMRHHDGNVRALVTSWNATMSKDLLHMTPSPPTMSSPEEGTYFWLYKLSYLWFSVIGFLITTLSGYLFSWLLSYFHWANDDHIFVDSHRKRIDYDLFIPPLSKRLRAKAGHEMHSLNSVNGENGLLQ